MAIISTHNTLAFLFGLLGNIVSFVVFVAPVPTFYRIVKKKSTEGFQSIPYVFALFSAMLWMYYASQKSDVFLLITINSVGCVIETIYLSLYIAYAPRKAKMMTVKLILLVNFVGFCSILCLTYFFSHGETRAKVVGWVCVAFSVSVFAAPLSIMRLVIRTKSVEFMPFNLSFFLTLSAVSWLLYGIALKDFYIAMPNVLGFTFGMAQMVLYMVYRKRKPVVEEVKVPEHNIDIVMLSTTVDNTTTPTPEKESAAAASTIHDAEGDNIKRENAKHNPIHDEGKSMESFINDNHLIVAKC